MSTSNVTHLATDHIRHLDVSTMKPFIESMGVVFLAVLLLPYSQRSRIFEPKYGKVADSLQDMDINFAQINFIGNADILAPYEMINFPHLMLFQGLDQYVTYRGANRETDITSYLDRFSRFPVLSNVSTTSLSEFRSSSDVVVVGYVAPHDGKSTRQFEALAKKLHPEYVFGISNDPALAKLEGVELPSVVVYKDSDDGEETLPIMDNLDEMVAGLRLAARPLFIELVPEIHDDLLHMDIPFAYIFANTPEERARLREELEPLARQYHKEIQFIIADPNLLGEEVDDLHLDITRMPAFAVREPRANFRYPMKNVSGSFIDAIKSFVQDYLNGNLQPTIKSEPLPKQSEDSLVKVVGLNYQEIVMDPTKDVLLVFCVESCGSCKQFQPVVDEIADLYAASSRFKDKVTIAKVMYDANDTPERELRAFPSVKLFPAAAKAKPINYDGDRDVDSLIDLIRDRGTHKADLRDLGEKQIVDTAASTASAEPETCISDGDGACQTPRSLKTQGEGQKVENIVHAEL